MIDLAAEVIAANYPHAMRVRPQQWRQRSGQGLTPDRPLCITLPALMLAPGAR